MKKKFVVLMLSVAVTLSVAACGGSIDEKTSSAATPSTSGEESKQEEVKEPVNLEGNWKSEENEGTWMEADISGEVITVNWVMDNGDSSAIYWVGTYQAPTEYTTEYTWTSERDKEQTDDALMASTDDTKDFTYSDANQELSYKVSVSGITNTVKLTKTE